MSTSPAASAGTAAAALQRLSASVRGLGQLNVWDATDKVLEADGGGKDW